MGQHLPTEKLELIHGVSDLVDRNGLWLEIARLGMTREFIQRSDNLYARIILELDFIEQHAPAAINEARRLRSLAGSLALKDHRTPPAA